MKIFEKFRAGVEALKDGWPVIDDEIAGLENRLSVLTEMESQGHDGSALFEEIKLKMRALDGRRGIMTQRQKNRLEKAIFDYGMR